MPRHGQTADYAELLEAAKDAVAKDPKKRTQTELAAELDVSDSYLSRALNIEGGRYAKLQRAIIAHLTDYAVEEEKSVRFRFVRKA